MAEAIYINGVYCKKKNYGIGISGKASDIIAEIQKHTNSKGYIRWELKERKEPDKNGNSHYLVVDTWEPQQNGAPSPIPPAYKREPVQDMSRPIDRWTEPMEDLPF